MEEVSPNGAEYEEEPSGNGDAPANGGVETVAAAGVADSENPPPPTGDPFLDELRRVTTEEPGDGDPITDFLEDDESKGAGGWFGRRK
ncbi:MAG: hypothetical protein AAGK32_02595 [Actinomycetota bacterium]